MLYRGLFVEIHWATSAKHQRLDGYSPKHTHTHTQSFKRSYHLYSFSFFQFYMTYDLYICAFAGAGITLLALVSDLIFYTCEL